MGKCGINSRSFRLTCTSSYGMLFIDKNNITERHTGDKASAYSLQPLMTEMLRLLKLVSHEG